MKRLFKLLVSCLILGSITVSVLGCSSLDRGLENLKQKACLHNFTKEEIVIKPTCENNGLAVKKCNSCGFSESIILQPQHVEVVLDAVAPTPISEGLTEGLACSVCEKVLVSQEKVSTIDVNEYLKLFENPDTYTEVDAEKGESILGNVYRMYKHDFTSEDSYCATQGHNDLIRWSRMQFTPLGLGKTLSFYVYPIGDEENFVLGFEGGSDINLSYSGTFSYIDYGSYVDFYVGELVVNDSSSDFSYTITEETVIEDFTNECLIKRLILN